MNFEKLEKLQSKMSQGTIKLDIPCGAEPMVELLGGISAQAQINLTKPGRFPQAEEAFVAAQRLIALLQS